MLQKDRSVRLGVRNDFLDIRGHQFFAPINWALLDEKRLKPPFNPNVVSETVQCCEQSARESSRGGQGTRTDGQIQGQLSNSQGQIRGSQLSLFCSIK